MDPMYERIRKQALRIAAQYPSPSFYQDYKAQAEYSAKFFASDPVVCELRDFVAEKIENDFGHGLDHVNKVALDAGALLAIECAGRHLSDAHMDHRIRMGQCAGLLHDIKRKRKDHAREGALYAREVLKGYPFSADDTTEICVAIQNHEAFGEIVESKSPGGALLSDCLYDADKFRWGPENFTHTVWDMVAFADIPVERFVTLYPRGISFLTKIKDTFRSRTGKAYGPQFIDLGLAIGRELYDYIRVEFSVYF